MIFSDFVHKFAVACMLKLDLNYYFQEISCFCTTRSLKWAQNNFLAQKKPKSGQK